MIIVHHTIFCASVKITSTLFIVSHRSEEVCIFPCIIHVCFCYTYNYSCYITFCHLHFFCAKVGLIVSRMRISRISFTTVVIVTYIYCALIRAFSALERDWRNDRIWARMQAQGAGVQRLSSLPLQVVIYFSGWYLVFFYPALLAALIYKGVYIYTCVRLYTLVPSSYIHALVLVNCCSTILGIASYG